MTRVWLAMLVVFMAQSVAAQTRIAAILIQFPDSVAPHPQVLEQARSDMQTADAFYSEVSYGQFTTASDVFGVYTVALDRTANRFQLKAAAVQAATAAGVDVVPYGEHIVVVSPTTDTVRGGYGDLTGVWIALLADRVAPPGASMVSHELGHHLFGLGHAHGQVCHPTCKTWEYGDSLDTMGEGAGWHFNALTKASLGWLVPQVVTTSGEYVIAPLETTTGVRVLSFQGGRRDMFTYYVEYRQPVGFDTTPFFVVDPANVFSGVVFHLALNGSMLLEMNRADPSGPYAQYPNAITSPALLVGQQYCDADGKVSVSVISADSAGARVRFKFGGRC